ncbi:MAG: sulfite exporter TauE/SafE family protein [Planctomycetes bacterium]|nr:sulfite exporter TauE/SafE family protein [Planctomycetota bacterium]
MCGPLAMMLQGGTKCALSYHTGRITAYGVIGVALGGLGSALGSNELATPTASVAFVLAAGLVILALSGSAGALRIPGLSRIVPRITARTRRLSPARRAGLLGLVTPLLPCGLLWSVFAGASVAGSTLAGASVMVGFALGSLPLLFLAQSQAGRLTQRFGPRTVQAVQRAAMLLAAAALVWRGYANLQAGGSCCH